MRIDNRADMPGMLTCDPFYPDLVMTQHLDTSNLLCPMPVIRTQDKIAEMQEGETLEVLATDPGVKNDIPAWCRINGHTVMEIREEGREIIITIEVGPQS
jgi:tRNA 2-thiouridine synthesizing protein A